MRKLLAAFAAFLLLAAGAEAIGDGNTDDPTVQADNQITAVFFGVQPNEKFQVRWYAYHYEGDPFPYVLGTNAHSNANGTVKAIAYMDDLSSHYSSNDGGPVYETRVCLLTVDTAEIVQKDGLDECHDTYVGYYPESMWYYEGPPK